MYEHFDYKPKSTKVDSPIDLALGTKAGVCQDFAHIMIALVRSKLRIPCRYVSGYLFHGESDMDRSINSATHAWVEALLPQLGWVGFDPTNWLVAGDRHIRTAIGRDYADVPPTHGIFRGRAASELTVAVRVRREPRDSILRPGVTRAGRLVDAGREGDTSARTASPTYSPATDGAATAGRQRTLWKVDSSPRRTVFRRKKRRSPFELRRRRTSEQLEDDLSTDLNVASALTEGDRDSASTVELEGVEGIETGRIGRNNVLRRIGVVEGKVRRAVVGSIWQIVDESAEADPRRAR